MRRLGPLVVSLSLVASVGFPGVSVAQSPDPRPRATAEERSASLARPAIVYVEIAWKGWVRDQSDGQVWMRDPIEMTTGCTGFAVNPEGYIVTAGHCVDPGIEGIAPAFFNQVIEYYQANGYQPPTFEQLQANSILEGVSAGTPPERSVFVQRGAATSGLRTGQALPARVVAFESLSAGDVTLLKVEEQNMSTVRLAPRSAIEIGTPILAVGYPGSAESVSDATLEPTNKDGKISAKRTSGGVPFYEISAATTQGMSGGPVVDASGRVVGSVSFGPAGESQAFNFIAPSSIIEEVLTKNGVENVEGRVDRLYRAGLERYWAGNYTQAISRFDAILDMVPSHQQAQEFKQKAGERRTQYGDYEPPSSGRGKLIAAMLLLLILGGLAGAFFLGRRRRGPAVPTAPAAESETSAGGTSSTATSGAEPPMVAFPSTLPVTSAPQSSPPPIEISPASAPAPQLAQVGGTAVPRTSGAPQASSDGLRCPNCRAELRSMTSFCVHCGAALGGPPEART